MPSKGIDHSTCPKARVVRSLWSEKERAFAEVLMRAFVKPVNIFLKVRVLDVIELIDEPDKRRLFFWRDILGDKHFDYVVCRRDTLEPLLAVELDDPRRSSTADDVKTTAARRAAFPLVYSTISDPGGCAMTILTDGGRRSGFLSAASDAEVGDSPCYPT